MSDTPMLPFHFVWRSGAETTSLSAALDMLDDEPESAAWHLGEGHLQQALRDQGYTVIAADLGGGTEGVTTLRERLRIAIELHRTWWSAQEAGDALGKAIGSLGGILRRRGKDLFDQSRKQLSGFRAWLAESIRPR